MARLTLVSTTRGQSNQNLTTHRASTTEGEAARKLLEANGFSVKGPNNKQYTSPCPFHEEPGTIPRGKSPNFYFNAETSVYFCQSVSCGEKGNLRTLERHFGIDQSDDYVATYRARDDRLTEYELNLGTPLQDQDKEQQEKFKNLRQPFYDHGLSDVTIERFRLGYQPEHEEEKNGRTITIPGRYVIPYLEGRKPKFFRFYDPNPATNQDGKFKYTWEDGVEASLFNAGDAIGDEKDGVAFIAEGELKAMLLVQMGYASVAVPGAGMWKPEWQAMFTHAKKIMVCYDNDNPEFHKPKNCSKCNNKGLSECIGHNVGQEAALARVDQLGWRAKNVLLPLLDDSLKKTDINDYFMRDGFSNADFAELATGKRATPYKVQSLAEITASPPEEAKFLIEQGILSAGGRLLVAGSPKVGKSLFINNLALSLASGLPFLRSGNHRGFKVDHPTRTLLLDRELSKHSLFTRLSSFTKEKPAFQAAGENLLIDHDHLIRLDQPNAYEVLLRLIEENGAEVCILDTAYKFFGGDVESSSALMKGFNILDKLIHETGCAFVLTHHNRKSGNSNSGKQQKDFADPNNVVGSFLWTGWPNATVLLNFMNRSVQDPFNAVATFAAFRDAAPPEPLALYRSRESITYTAIDKYSHDDDEFTSTATKTVTKPTTEAVADLLLRSCPTTEDDFIHMAAAHFGVQVQVIRPYFIDVMSGGDFERVGKRPPIIKFKHEIEPDQTWEQEHHLPDTELPKNAGAGLAELDPFDSTFDF